jgi:MFS family permease
VADGDRAPNRDFWAFWVGQAVSTLGTSFTTLALPLLVYRLTGSAVNLALTSAAEFLPYPLFGLIIGAWVDRLNRKRLMIAVNVMQAVVIGSIPILAALGHLAIEWIYAMGFAGSTLGIFFSSAEFAAIPSLVSQDDIVTANGRIQASYSAMSIIGPLLAGGLATAIPVERMLYVDAASYLAAAGALCAVRRGFNPVEERARNSIRRDIAEGLRYVLGHPVLRNISIMMALVNMVAASTGAQLVFFAKQRLSADNAQVGIIYAAGSAGIVALSLAAGPLRKRFSFSTVALSALMIDGLLIVAFAAVRLYAVNVVLWGLLSGFGILFNINTGSLRQAIVPNEMLGRVVSIAGVLAWSAIPIGAFLGGVLIERTGNVALIYGAIGVITFLIPLAFAFTPLGHADRYLAKPPASDSAEEQVTATG